MSSYLSFCCSSLYMYLIMSDWVKPMGPKGADQKSVDEVKLGPFRQEFVVSLGDMLSGKTNMFVSCHGKLSDQPQQHILGERPNAKTVLSD